MPFILIPALIFGFITSALAGFAAFVIGAPFCPQLPPPNPEMACRLTLSWLAVYGIGWLPGGLLGAGFGALLRLVFHKRRNVFPQGKTDGGL